MFSAQSNMNSEVTSKSRLALVGPDFRLNCIQKQELRRYDRKRPTVPFVQCGAGGSSVPSGWDWLFRLTVAKFRMPGCSVWSIYEVSSR